MRNVKMLTVFSLLFLSFAHHTSVLSKYNKARIGNLENTATSPQEKVLRREA